jgi:pimeloyl-ACP methyl ester carboxylesterase
MMRPRWWMSLLILATLPIAAGAQGQPRLRDAMVIFKDGYYIKGKIDEQVREYIYDPKSGQSFPILSGDFFIDDHVRKIKFSAGNVQKVVHLKAGDVKAPMRIERIQVIPKLKDDILSSWHYVGFSKWTGAGERTVSLKTPPSSKFPQGGNIEVKQKFALFTPHHLFAYSSNYNWELRYFASEFSPEEMREMLLKVFEEKKDLKTLPKGQKFLEIARFLNEAGWFKETEVELANIVQNFPDQKKLAEELLDKLREKRANLFVESIQQASKIGQHQVALDRLDYYSRLEYAKLVTPSNRTEMKDLVADYAKGKANVEVARKHLNDLPTFIAKKDQPRWNKAIEFILDELNYDTVGRLDKFLLFALQHETQRAAKGAAPTQTPEEVLAIAISSWLQGDQAAESDTTAALKLADARAFLLEYLKTESDFKRGNLLSAYKSENKLPMDVMARLVRMIPPPVPHPAKEINTEIQTIKTAAPNNNGGSYFVQLPPDYHHQRAYPVVMVLHSSREPKAEVTLKRFSEEAAKRGFILAAPNWTGGKTPQRGRQREQDVVLDTLRDLRRRFQVDSDRVFLFGWEDGANLAFDVGLGHPDLFAGVVPMNGSVTTFQRKYYWPNAQYLPFYVIDGERNSGSAKQMHDLFKEWTRAPFASMYVEYIGRASEWFSAEVPQTMSWMSGKKRHTPTKEMGRVNNGSTLGEEFHSSRPNENRFYWLSSEAIDDRCLADINVPLTRVPGTYRPAMFQASLAVGNKSKKEGKEDIWNQINIRVSGMRQVSFWIAPEMMNLALPLQIHVNGDKVGQRRQIQPSLETMLEELYQSGDRQRLFVAKVDVKIGKN